MKTSALFFTTFILFSFFSKAQQTEKTDTVEIHLGKNIFITILGSTSSDTLKDIDTVNVALRDNKKKKKKFKGYWRGLELGINGLMTSDNSFNLPSNVSYLDLNYGKSWFVNLNFMELKLPIYKNNLGVLSGLSLNLNNYRFLNKNMLLGSTDSITYTYDTTSGFNYTKNKISAIYLKIPLLFEIYLPQHKKFHFLTGIYGSLLIGSYTKTLYKEGSRKTKNKNHDIPYLNPLQYGVTGRIGIGHLTFFVDYNFSLLFKKDKGPALHPINMGIAFRY